ncbi:hypothetical protein MTR_5g053480 [Medicago truncatula]|uniref:Uncharacterized protein n=1 Tax=Medicago truncatula TaxID=3880 RepID=G7JX43_MEDTR|nr:hypothetical protein MTR_5g053480 [Medicago truncatula]
MINRLVDRLHLYDTEEIVTLEYENYLLSWKIKQWDNQISRLNARCDLHEANHQGTDCEGLKELINIDYNTQLQNILDDFLILNQVPFEKFEVQCGDLVRKANECEKQLVEMETECHVVVEENAQVRSVRLYLKSQPTGLKETIPLQRYIYSSLWRDNSNVKSLAVGSWEHLLLCMKFMEFLPKKRNKKDDIFFLSYLPP